MQRPAIDTVSLSPWWGTGEQTASVYIPLMIGTEVSYNFGILASEDNHASSAQDDGNGDMSPALAGSKP